MRRFYLLRDYDPSGVSGTGVVAEGVEFSDGMAVMRWRRAPYGLNVYHCMDALIAVHGHGGASHIRFVDDNGQVHGEYVKHDYCKEA